MNLAICNASANKWTLAEILTRTDKTAETAVKTELFKIF